MLADLPDAITTDPFHTVMLERLGTGLYLGPLAMGEAELALVRPLPSAWDDARLHHHAPTTHTGVMAAVNAAVIHRARRGLPLESFGVADSVEQFLDRFPALLADERPLAVTFRRYHRDDPSAGPGWRWEAHGEYVGVHTRHHENLADEPEIEEVVVFQIHELLPVPTSVRPHTFRA